MPPAHPDRPPADPATVARYLAELAGEPHGRAGERAVAEMVRRAWPGVADELRAVDAWHARQAAEAVTGAYGEPARGVVFAGLAYPPGSGALPHLEAARAAPRARFGYCSGGEAIALMWRGALRPGGGAVAWQARGDDPWQVCDMARREGLGAPLSVQLRLALPWWPAGYAAWVIAGYAEALPPGSSLAVTGAVPGGTPSRPEVARALHEGIAPTWQHSPEAIASWIEAAGMTLAGRVEDVRGWAGEELAAASPSRFAGAVALRP